MLHYRLGALLLFACDPPAPSAVADAPEEPPGVSAHAPHTNGSADASGAPKPRPAPYPPSPRTLDCTNYFGCAIRAGKLACWGFNQFGQLGAPPIPYPARSASHVDVPAPVAVTTGFTHACAMSASGELYCWGTSSDGALGDGLIDQPGAEPRVVLPTRIALGAKVVDVDASVSHTCAALDDGRVACWGDNASDALGVGAPSSPSPVLVAGVQGAVEVSTSDDLSCARTGQGEVVCWGRGKPPERIAGACAQQITTGSSGACAVDCGGATVSCWGDLPGSASASVSPRAQPGLRGVSEIRGGYAHFVARDGAGQLRTWGANDSGQIGNGKPATWIEAFASEPVNLNTSWRASAVCAGGIAARNGGRAYLRPATFLDTGTTCAMTSDGEVYCWGEPDLDYSPKRVRLPE